MSYLTVRAQFVPQKRFRTTEDACWPYLWINSVLSSGAIYSYARDIGLSARTKRFRQRVTIKPRIRQPVRQRS